LDGWLLAALDTAGAVRAEDFADADTAQTAGRTLADDQRLTHVEVLAWLESARARGLVEAQTVALSGDGLAPPQWQLTELGRQRLSAARLQAELVPDWLQKLIKPSLLNALKGLIAAAPVAALARYLHLVTPGSRGVAKGVLIAYGVAAIAVLVAYRYASSLYAWRRALRRLRSAETAEGVPIARAGRVAMPAEGLAGLERIEHIVVLMMENRSFDHMLGYLSLEGGRTEINGLRADMANDGHPVHHLDRTAMTKAEDPDHSGHAAERQINGGAMDGFVAAYSATLAARRDQLADAGMPGDPGLVMGYYNAGDLPAYDYLAEQFCVCDRWFSSVAGATWPNRLYSIAARAAGSKDDLKGIPHYNLPSLVRHLDDAKAHWRWYSHDPGTLRLVDSHYRLGHHGNFAFFDRRAVSVLTRVAEELVVEESSGFLDDAANGELPDVAWIDPNFVDVSILETASNDDHPPSDIRAGQQLVLATYDALRRGPKWNQTLLVITYDEHGGFYDHVAPEQAPDDDPAFRSYGVRVPALVISPLIEARSASHVVFDHTSLIKTIFARFCRDPDGTIPYMGARMAAANHLGVLLTRDTARADIPDHDDVVKQLSDWRAAFHEHKRSQPQQRTPPRQLGDFQAGVVASAKDLRARGLPPLQP
jgi:phospholipase C